MKNYQLRRLRRSRRKRGIRKRLFGTHERPRLTVFRSSRHIYAQLVNDLDGRTIVSASTVEKDNKAAHGGNRDAAAEIGRTIAERAKGAGVETVIFDRNGFRYHGRIKAIADAAREGGLRF